jgi:hypothetical protein
MPRLAIPAIRARQRDGGANGSRNRHWPSWRGLRSVDTLNEYKKEKWVRFEDVKMLPIYVPNAGG